MYFYVQNCILLGTNISNTLLHLLYFNSLLLTNLVKNKYAYFITLIFLLKLKYI